MGRLTKLVQLVGVEILELYIIFVLFFYISKDLCVTKFFHLLLENISAATGAGLWASKRNPPPHLAVEICVRPCYYMHIYPPVTVVFFATLSTDLDTFHREAFVVITPCVFYSPEKLLEKYKAQSVQQDARLLRGLGCFYLPSRVY